jgi:hypothetical protein
MPFAFRYVVQQLLKSPAYRVRGKGNGRVHADRVPAFEDEPTI